jgi:hypothetical protein
LTRNRKTRSSASSGLTETSSLGSQRTCQGCPGGRSSTHSTSTLKLPRNDNISAVLPTNDGTPSRRNSPNYSRPTSSEKSSILSGLPTPSSSARRTRTCGGCASTTPISTNTAPRTPSGCRRLTKSSTPRRAVTYSASSTATPGTSRSISRKKTRRRPRSSPRLAPTATQQCRSG